MQCDHDEDLKAIRNGVQVCHGCTGSTPAPLPAAIETPEPTEIENIGAIVQMLRQRAATADVQSRGQDGAAFRLAVQVILRLARHYGPLGGGADSLLIRAVR